MEKSYAQTSSGRQKQWCDKFDAFIKGGSPSLEGGMTPLNNLFGKKNYMYWQSKCY